MSTSVIVHLFPVFFTFSLSLSRLLTPSLSRIHSLSLSLSFIYSPSLSHSFATSLSLIHVLSLSHTHSLPAASLPLLHILLMSWVLILYSLACARSLSHFIEYMSTRWFCISFLMAFLLRLYSLERLTPSHHCMPLSRMHSLSGRLRMMCSFYLDTHSHRCMLD